MPASYQKGLPFETSKSEDKKGFERKEKGGVQSPPS
jgi:hypothetical protein